MFTRSSTDSFARSNLSGLTSSASMLLEVSTANIMSMPRVLVSSQRYPHWGRARAANISITAQNTSAFLTIIFGALTVRVSSGISLCDANFASALRLAARARSAANARTAAAANAA